jgi:outer membrane protein OmpA-like peptidoglycan-associated protein
MAGLMLIFLLIAIVYIRVQVEATEQAKVATERAIEAAELAEKQRLETESIKKQIKEIAVAWQKSSEEIAAALKTEFAADLRLWNAEIDEKNLTIRFNAPEVLFPQNSAVLKPEFESILADFFPRYLSVLRRYLGIIDEIRIEGHSSSEWTAGMDPLDAFFENMELSQDRTRAVLQYSLELEDTDSDRDWATKKITANGLSSSRIILRDDGSENPEASRRVEFKVRTKAQEQIIRILESVE